ncbi:MAG TPA: protein-glutamate O-methyltransferase CheR [Thermoanaerobaculia bacterium]
MNLTTREFGRFQSLIHRQAGIFLPEAKQALVVARLGRRLRELGLDNFGAYFELVEADPAEHTLMLDAICTNETRFFREPRQFEFLDTDVLPRWRQRGEGGLAPKRIRAWSAACSTGEEPYSLAMLLRTHFPLAGGWTVEILASDLSTKVLAAAREAVWPIERAEDIPADYRRAYMLRGFRGEEGKMRAQPNITSMVEFQRINLNDERYPVDGPFDLIFCRNVLIYFDRETKAAVIDRLTRHLSPTGLLFLGHSETLHTANHALKHVGPTAYALS